MATGFSSRPSTDQSPPAPDAETKGIEALKKLNISGRNPQRATLRSLGTTVGLQQVRKLLELGLNEFQIKLNSDLIKRLQVDFQAWVKNTKQVAENNVRNAKQLSNQRWLLNEINLQNGRQGSQAPRFVCDFLFQQIGTQLEELAKLTALSKQFRRNLAAATTQKVRQELILHFAQCLNPDPDALVKDERAFARWFDEEALSDRFQKRQGEEELALCFTLDRMAATVVHIFHRAMEFNNAHFGGSADDLNNRINGIWQRLNVEASLLPALVYQGDVRIHCAAMKSLRVMLEALPSGIAWTILSKRIIGFIDRSARQKNSDVWIQCEALTILSNLSADTAMKVIDQRLSKPGTGDDIFVRRHAWGLIEKFLSRGDGHDIVLSWPADSSSFVRQKTAEALFLSFDRLTHRRWRQITLGDPDPKVRAAAICTAARPGLHTQQSINFFRVLPHVLKSEQDDFVLRTALWTTTEVLARSLAKLVAQTQGDPTQARFTIQMLFTQQIQPAIELLQSTHCSIAVRRWAAQCNERIWGLLDQQIKPLIDQMSQEVNRIKPGRSRTYPRQWFNWVDDESLTRMFAVLSQDDFGYDIQKTWLGLRVTRGPVFGVRLWRLLFEFRRSATDKRQGHRHSVGRISTARLKAPSQILGELSETKVPGEPLTIASDGTWRPFLPLVDDLISALNMSWFKPVTVKIVSSQGVTALTPPHKIRQRIAACYSLTKNFAKYAGLRNWDGGTTDPDSYIRSIEDLGFEVSFKPHRYLQQDAVTKEQSPSTPQDQRTETILDSSVTKFFGNLTQFSQVLLPLATHLIGTTHYDKMLVHLKRFTEYFSSLYENSLGELVLFSCLVLLLVMTKHLWMNFSFRQSRKKIPLSIGGWGTRGKSGTERLKAALLGVMGHGLVSKTTGCEAMFIHSYAFGQPLEIPFFRPYDKATIWEQRNLVNIAAKLKPSVFLWECMALNPDYVNVLQHQWMQDDIATITNTYPDHEDIQGPAGYDVAETISGFVPKKSLLVTTEEQMKPFVTRQCQRHRTTIQSVGWLQSGLITDDILERFPYQEHPDNIALVSQMASNLGMTHEQSVKAMADDLVPDLGVLKTHPISTVDTRRIEFTNGMSANERFGCMGNWKRLKYDTQDPWTDPTTWVVGVINNRADRVPRSRVFAKIIVEDVNADRFFLIGTNLNGLKKFIDEAWQNKCETMTLKKPDGVWDTQAALTTLKEAAWKFRQPVAEEHITRQLKHMITSVIEASNARGESNASVDLSAVTPSSDLAKLLAESKISDEYIKAIVAQQAWLNRAYAEFQELHEAIEDAPDEISDTVDGKYRAILGRWFSRKLIVVANAEATGEQVLDRIVHKVPPGYLARTMGLQNIKGTGLDFVYRFQAWSTCFEACEATQDRRLATAEKAIAALVAMPAIGQLCVEKLLKTIALCRTNKMLQRSDLQSQLDNLKNRVDAVNNKSTGGPTSSTNAVESSSQQQNAAPLRHCLQTLNQWSVQWAEEFLDVNDSIRRREKADLIYRDYVACRISRQRAVVELRILNKRQKGGWLKEDSKKVRKKLLLKSK